MEPLNKKERIKTFWKFFLFFAITVVLLITAVFINFQIPHKENKLLRSRYERLNNELQYQTEFSQNIYEVKTRLDSINQSGQNVMYLEQLISARLASVKESIPAGDSLQQAQLYDYVIQALLSLQESKRNLRDLRESEKLIVEYRENLERYKKALEQTQRDLDICRQL